MLSGGGDAAALLYTNHVAHRAVRQHGSGPRPRPPLVHAPLPHEATGAPPGARHVARVCTHTRCCAPGGVARRCSAKKKGLCQRSGSNQQYAPQWVCRPKSCNCTNSKASLLLRNARTPCCGTLHHITATGALRHRGATRTGADVWRWWGGGARVTITLRWLVERVLPSTHDYSVCPPFAWGPSPPPLCVPLPAYFLWYLRFAKVERLNKRRTHHHQSLRS